ncbi:MAG: putative lipoprotein [Myxococcaceae bacterium]|nr:putative lipoprotein [Myxococcaceae bacterium]
MSIDKRSGSSLRLATAGVLCGLLAVGCGGNKSSAGQGTTVASKDGKSARPAGAVSQPLPLEGKASEGHCDANAKQTGGNGGNYEVSEYDTSGDDTPDVRKVFLRLGEGTLARLVLVCRESDLNADGRKDVVRVYSDEGKPLREEADRNFDGKMDEVTFFQEGQVLRQEFDYTGDGKVDTKIYFDAGKPLRAERDLKARSTIERWQPDRWEYYEDGRVVRMGTDVDGDGKVDRWDRDVSIRRNLDLGQDSPAASDSASDSGPA